MFARFQFKLRGLIGSLHKNRTMIAVSAVVVALWAVALFASTDLWRNEVPSVRAVGTRAPVRIVMTPVLYHRHHAVAVRRTSRRRTRATKLKTVKAKRLTAVNAGIRKRAGVELTAKQSGFVQKLGQYLHSRGQSATVTSGARTPQHQLAIIESKIRSMGLTSRFPEIRRATVSKTSSWLRAWEYLRARHVPVYAPCCVPGVEVETSNHLRGLAVDLIAGSLDRLSSLIADFAHSSYALHSPLRVASIAREPGCVHVNLATRS